MENVSTEVLKSSLSYNPKTNKIQISSVIENCTLYGDYITIKEEDNKQVNLKDIDTIIESFDSNIYNFTLYSFKGSMREAEKNLFVEAFSFFFSKNDNKAAEKLASYI